MGLGVGGACRPRQAILTKDGARNRFRAYVLLGGCALFWKSASAHPERPFHVQVAGGDAFENTARILRDRQYLPVGDMRFVWTRNRILLVALLVMGVVLARGAVSIGLDAVADARLPNPDSFYKLVLLDDHDPQQGFHFIARDNAPDGNWVHWSLPHSWSVWQLHRPLGALGLTQRQALLWAGVGITMLSMLLLSALVALAVFNHASQRAAIVAMLTLATSVPLLSYGRIDQITHHIFMLVPVAAAAACFFRGHGLHRPAWLDGLGGALLGMALWISPETMPLVVGVAAIRAAQRLESSSGLQGLGQGLIPVAIGLVAMVAIGWIVDPPPPGYSTWALDHISLAWLSFAVVLALLLGLAEVLAVHRWPLSRSLAMLVVATVVAAAVWLWGVPGALQGPTGLVPTEMKLMWWDHIKELQSAHAPYQWAAYLMMPLVAAAVTGFAAWKTRRLSLALLALMSLVYGVLGVWHLRMGAAAALVAALALGLGLTQFRIFAHGVADATLTLREQWVGFIFTLLPVLQLVLVVGLLLLEEEEKQPIDCSLSSIAPAMNALPPATILVPVFSAPELLYFTHHRTIAGPYHHNVDGILDVYRAWADADGEHAMAVIKRRGVRYVLGCTGIQRQLRGTDEAPSLASRVAEGLPPNWLEAMPWADGIDTEWRLYRVVETQSQAPLD